MSQEKALSLRAILKNNKNLFNLLVGRSLSRIAISLLSVFMPVFLFQLFNDSFTKTVLFYLASSLVYILLVPLGAKVFEKLGTKKSLVLGTFLSALYFAWLSFSSQIPIVLFISILLLFLIISRTLFWLPYHIDFALFTKNGSRGSQMGVWYAVVTLIGVVGPILGALIIDNFSFNSLFVIAFLLYLFAIAWYSHVPNTNHTFSWNYKETWRQLVRKDNRMGSKSFFAEGVETGVGMVVWPVFIYQIFQGDLMQIGIISSIIVGITVILQIVVGKYIDKDVATGKDLLKKGSLLYALGWIFKIFIATALHVFVIDIYHRISRVVMRLPFDAITYDTAAHQGQYIDEFTVLREMSLHAGRVLSYTLAILLSLVFPIPIVFIVGAVASIVISFVQVNDNTKKSVA